MTVDNPEETTGLAPAEGLPAGADVISEDTLVVTDDTQESAALVSPAAPTPDSVPPASRRLAPPPKPRRDSAPAARSSSQPAPEGPADSIISAALKAPAAPAISYRPEAVADGVPPVSTEGSEPERSQPPPIPRRRSNPSIPADAAASAQLPSEPVLPPAPRSGSSPSLTVPRPGSSPSLAAPRPGSSAAFTAPRPASSYPQAPPRPASNPPQEPLTARSPSPPPPVPMIPVDNVPRVSTTPSSPPGSSRSVMAMRIIAVGDSQRPPPPSIDIDVDTSSLTPSEILAAVPSTAAPPASPLPPAAPATSQPPGAPPPPVRARASEEAEVLRDEDVAPDSSERSPAHIPPPPPPAQAAPPVEELGREDAISVPPDDPSAFVATRKADAKGEAKPPPPPKRLPRPPEPGPAEQAPAEAEAPPPVPAAAEAPSIKGAPKSKARHPWWEDLFNEDFMRANKRLSDEQIRREVTFIEESLGVAAGGVVLDLGCGDGHHAVELASRGYGVVGYDLSLYQLALAADVAQERGQKINFLQGDMREMAFEEMFDGVFCWNTTFGYFEEEKNLAVAQRVFKALRPGGMFLVDVVNRDYAAAQAPQQLWYEGDSCVCMDDMSIDYIASRLRVKRSIILDDGRTKESTYSLRLYTMNELGKLLHDVGFRVTEASGHPATPGVFFGPNSPRVIMLAQRP